MVAEEGTPVFDVRQTIRRVPQAFANPFDGWLKIFISVVR